MEHLSRHQFADHRDLDIFVITSSGATLSSLVCRYDRSSRSNDLWRIFDARHHDLHDPRIRKTNQLRLHLRIDLSSLRLSDPHLESHTVCQKGIYLEI